MNRLAPVELALVLGGCGLVIMGALILWVEKLTRPNPGYRRRHDRHAARPERPSLAGGADPPTSWAKRPSGSWRVVGGPVTHRAEAGPVEDTKSLHPGYYAAGRARVMHRPPQDLED